MLFTLHTLLNTMLYKYYYAKSYCIIEKFKRAFSENEKFKMC